MKFIITGMPRTRSAWFAAYFTEGRTYCHHEATFHNNSMEIPGFDHVGNSDSGYVISKDWVEENPVDKIVVIHRSIDDVERSLKSIGQTNVRWLLEQMEPALQGLNALHVDFNDINKRIKDIHDYLELPGYDPYRAALFSKMNIQSQYWRN
jgi:predicted nucleotidyltransferase